MTTPDPPLSGPVESRPTREQLLAVIQAALDCGDMQGVAYALQLLAVVSPDDCEAILAVLKLREMVLKP